MKRNFLYPIAMLLLLFLTSTTVVIVVQNSVQLLIGLKELPRSTTTVSYSYRHTETAEQKFYNFY